MVCCFFGHRDVPDGLSEKLLLVLEGLVNEGADTFLVGHQGGFDRVVLGVLRQLKRKFPQICYYVVLAYMPGTKEASPLYAPEETLYPEGLETAHPRYAISKRNQYMIREADVVVAYITHTWGGAAKYADLAAKKGKRVIHLGTHSSKTGDGSAI